MSPFTATESSFERFGRLSVAFFRAQWQLLLLAARGHCGEDAVTHVTDSVPAPSPWLMTGVGFLIQIASLIHLALRKAAERHVSFEGKVFLSLIA